MLVMSFTLCRCPPEDPRELQQAAGDAGGPRQSRHPEDLREDLHVTEVEDV